VSEREWWEPVLCDAEYCNGLRADYPDKANWSDEELIEHFAQGRKYAVTWDHLGDAYADYEKLADAYLKLKKQAP
jgi:hypothetical protein